MEKNAASLGSALVKAVSLFAAVVLGAELQATSQPLEYRRQTIQAANGDWSVRVPAGYVLELLSEDLQRPRLLTFSEDGDLFIGSRSGNVYRMPPPYRTPQVLVRMDGYPHSVAFRPGEILIAETRGVYRAPYRSGHSRVASRSLTLLAPLPGGGGHTSRTAKVGPDGRVYVSLGISGNCSDQYLDESYPFQARRGGVLRLEDRDNGPRWEPFASGLRNPVGFDWHPDSGVMYASNNGPDHLGFEQPPEYFSRLTPGSFHGMPWFQHDGRQIRRDDCISRAPPRPRDEVSAPVATFPPRNAPMDVAFVPRGAMDPRLVGDAIVALRGSWGTSPSGGFRGDPATRRHPKIVAVRFENETPVGVDDLITGFQMSDGDRWARPVGVAVGPDGNLYFSSDSGVNGLFRLTRSP